MIDAEVLGVIRRHHLTGALIRPQRRRRSTTSPTGPVSATAIARCSLAARAHAPRCALGRALCRARRGTRCHTHHHRRPALDRARTAMSDRRHRSSELTASMNQTGPAPARGNRARRRGGRLVGWLDPSPRRTGPGSRAGEPGPVRGDRVSWRGSPRRWARPQPSWGCWRRWCRRAWRRRSRSTRGARRR